MFATSAVVLALAAAVAHAQDVSIQTPSLAQVSAISVFITILLVSSTAQRVLAWLTIVLTVRELCGQLLWRLWSLLCCQYVSRLRDAPVALLTPAPLCSSPGSKSM